MGGEWVVNDSEVCRSGNYKLLEFASFDEVACMMTGFPLMANFGSFRKSSVPFVFRLISRFVSTSFSQLLLGMLTTWYSGTAVWDCCRAKNAIGIGL